MSHTNNRLKISDKHSYQPSNYPSYYGDLQLKHNQPFLNRMFEIHVNMENNLNKI